MWRGSLVKVVRKSSFTSREELSPGRFHAILKARARVPDDSYLFIGAMPQVLEALPEIPSVIDEFLKGEVSLEVLERKVVETFMKFKKSAPVKAFPRYPAFTYFIPGSSIKGAVRSRVEYKFKPIKVGNQMVSYSCYIVQNGVGFSRTHIDLWGEDVSLRREGPCRPNENDPRVCIVCDIFGAPGLASRVLFSDALMTKGTPEILPDLDSIEVVAPKSEFDLKIVARNFDFVESGILAIGMELHTKSPILIGMYKYRFHPLFKQLYRGRYAFGLLQFELTEVKLFDLKGFKNVDPNDFITDSLKKLRESEYGDKIAYEKGSLIAR